MVKDHSDSEKGNPLPPHRLLLSINSKGSFICIPRPLLHQSWSNGWNELLEGHKYLPDNSAFTINPTVVQWVMGSIPQCGPIELFLVPASAPQLVQQRPWYVLSCLWNDAYKRTLAANRKE